MELKETRERSKDTQVFYISTHLNKLLWRGEQCEYSLLLIDIWTKKSAMDCFLWYWDYFLEWSYDGVWKTPLDWELVRCFQKLSLSRTVKSFYDNGSFPMPLLPLELPSHCVLACSRDWICTYTPCGHPNVECGSR